METKALCAIALGIAAKRDASSHGSSFIRASAERTLSRIPPASSQIGAKRNSSYREVRFKTEGRLPITKAPWVQLVEPSLQLRPGRGRQSERTTHHAGTAKFQANRSSAQDRFCSRLKCRGASFRRLSHLVRRSALVKKVPRTKRRRAVAIGKLKGVLLLWPARQRQRSVCILRCGLLPRQREGHHGIHAVDHRCRDQDGGAALLGGLIDDVHGA
jgi:hypothetical protein